MGLRACTAHRQPCLPAHAGLLGRWSPRTALGRAVVATCAGSPCLWLGGGSLVVEGGVGSASSPSAPRPREDGPNGESEV